MPYVDVLLFFGTSYEPFCRWWRTVADNLRSFLIGLSFDSLFIYLEWMLTAADVNSSENFSVVDIVVGT